MISVTDLRAGVVFEERSEYFLVISYEHIKIARGSGTVKVKVKNLTTGATVDKSFITGAKVAEVALERKKVQFLYKDQKIHVMDMGSFEQKELDLNVVSDVLKYLKEGMEIELFSIEGNPLYVQIPNIVEYKIEQTAGSARGNTVGASYKDALLENGLNVKVPLFIKSGEVIRVDTRSGDYVERAK